MANVVANALRAGDDRVVREFFQSQIGMARRKHVHTMLVSAENFYAMSTFAVLSELQPCAKPLETDHRLIQDLRALIPDSVNEIQIVCYVRRPDRFVESLYNQRVKRDLFHASFDEFVSLAHPALLYSQHMELWADVFGRANCMVRLYDVVASDVVTDFSRSVLGIEPAALGSEPAPPLLSDAGRSNESVGRDLLEFKKIKNEFIAATERDMEFRILLTLEHMTKSRASEPDSYQEFFTPPRRSDFLRARRSEMEELQATYDLPPFPALDRDSLKVNWKPYPGLDSDRLVEIQRLYDHVCRRSGFRLERFAIRLARSLRSEGVGRVLLAVLRAAGVKRGWRRVVRGFGQVS